MNVEQARSIKLGKTVLKLSFMEGIHEVVVTYWDSQGLVKAILKKVDPNANPNFSRLYGVGDQIDCMLVNLSF